jgi:voltage-gated potassium channel
MMDDVHKLMRGSTPIHFHLRRRLVIIFGASLVVALLGALAIYFFERHAKGTEIHTYGDAFFWTSGQLLTVSSQLRNPFSTGGRILDIFFELWAISMIAALAGSLGSFFTHKHHMDTKPPPSPSDLINRPLP